MSRSSLISVVYLIAGIAGYLALLYLRSQSDAPAIVWMADALGVIYGTLLYASGLAALYVACRFSWRCTTPAEVAAAIPFVLLPAYIGLIGLIHGYVSVYWFYASSGMLPRQGELYGTQAMVLICPLVGLGFSFPAFVILSIAMVIKSRSSGPANQNG